MATDRAVLLALADQVEALKEPSYEIADPIVAALDPDMEGSYELIIAAVARGGLTEAVALCAQKLPGWSGLIGFGWTGSGADSKQRVDIHSPARGRGEDKDGLPFDIVDEAYGESATPALSLTAAILRGLAIRPG